MIRGSVETIHSLAFGFPSSANASNDSDTQQVQTNSWLDEA